MHKKINSTILTAVFTGVALIALAFYKRAVGSINLSAADYYVAAAVIYLLSVVYALLRCKSCRNKTPNLG